MIDPVQKTDKKHVPHLLNPARTKHDRHFNIPLFMESLSWPADDNEIRDGFITLSISIYLLKSIYKQFRPYVEYFKNKQRKMKEDDENFKVRNPKELCDKWKWERESGRAPSMSNKKFSNRIKGRFPEPKPRRIKNCMTYFGIQLKAKIDLPFRWNE